MYQLNYSRDDIHLVGKDIVMNAPVQAIRVQETQEKEDIGFYARVPRIVRTGYQELSHAEKWLYTCLRDLCGEAGECWRSLRALAKETGISIASLSSMIPHLEKVGLIDAVKKSTWFIKIKNIWQANKEYCSKIEHSTAKCSENEQGVQKMNADCSENEQGCSNFVTKEDITKKIESEEDNTKKDISSTSVDDALPPYSDGLKPRNSILSGWLADISLMDDAFLAEMEKMLPPEDVSTPVIPTVDNDTSYPIASPKATRKKASKPKPEPAAPTIQLTEQQQAFWLLWCDIWFNQDIPPELNETAYKHVKKLAPLVKTKEQLEDLIKHARVEMEASGFKRKVVHLGNLVNSYPGWKQQSRPIAPGVAVPQNFTGMGRLLHIKPQEANRGQTFTS